MRLRLLLLPALASLLACPAEPPPEPPVGPDPAVPAAAGEVFAAPLAQESLAALATGIAAEARTGDIKLWNQRVAFWIQAPREGHGYVPSAGTLIDAVAGGSDDVIEDVFLSFGIGWLFDATSVVVEQDGVEGGVARVVASGPAVPWQFINGLLEIDDPLIADPQVSIAIAYELHPDEDFVRIETTLTNRSGEAVSINPSNGWMAASEVGLPWVAGGGLGAEASGEPDAVGYGGREDAASFGMWRPDGPMQPVSFSAVASSAGISLFSGGWLDVEDGGTLTFLRRLAIGPDLATVEAARLQDLGLPSARVGGTVTGGQGHLEVHFVRDDGYIGGFARVDEDGRFAATLPPGSWQAWAIDPRATEHVDLAAGHGRYSPFAAASVNEATLATLEGPAQQWGGIVGAPVAFQAEDGADLALSIESATPVRLRVTDGSGPMPAWVQVDWTAGGPLDDVPAELRPAFGLPDGSAARVWTADGDVTLPLHPGSYRAQIGGSFRHEPTTIDFEVAADPLDLDVELPQVVLRDGWISMDSHLHAAPSTDGELPMEDRVVTCAVSGVDMPVTTDHDRVSDYRPLVDALGLGDRMTLVPGVEVSPELRGHFNVFPIEPDRTLPNGGAPDWWWPSDRTEDLYARARAAGTADAIVSPNHPRDTGLFESAGYQPWDGESSRPDFWTWEFDAFELMNSVVDSEADALREDWFSFLDRGRRKSPMGVSDSHGRSSPCGFGRTDIYVGEHDPGDLDVASVLAAIRAGHTIVAGGVTLRVEGPGGALPGDTVTGSSASLHVTLAAPAPMAPQTLRVWRGGAVVHEQAVPGPEAGALRIDTTIEVSADADTWLVVEVVGGPAIGGIWRGGRPYAAANALFVDVDGDGWTAPLAR